MNLGSILGRIGKSALKSIPGVGAVTEILDFVNNCLPESKLNKDSTGDEALRAISKLPEVDQSAILMKKFDVEITEIKEWSNVVSSLAEVDKTGHSTRPVIAKIMAYLIGFGVVVILGPIAYAIIDGDSKMVDSIANAWPLIATVIGIPAGIVNSYFGKRTKEKAQKYEAATNVPQAAGVISQVIGMFRR